MPCFTCKMSIAYVTDASVAVHSNENVYCSEFLHRAISLKLDDRPQTKKCICMQLTSSKTKTLKGS